MVEGERLVAPGRLEGWAFDFMLGMQLRGKQLGIVGFGRIGRAVAAGGCVRDDGCSHVAIPGEAERCRSIVCSRLPTSCRCMCR